MEENESAGGRNNDPLTLGPALIAIGSCDAYLPERRTRRVTALATSMTGLAVEGTGMAPELGGTIPLRASLICSFITLAFRAI